MPGLEVRSRPLALGALAAAGVRGDAPRWYASLPRDAHGWWEAAEVAREGLGDWRAALAPAFGARGAAAERLATASAVVATGQQPGLFGGPLYTFAKAVSALAIADALQRVIREPVAPVFWAATDDSDLAEASEVTVVEGDRAVRITARSAAPESGASMSATPLGDVSAELAVLERACGSAPEHEVLERVRAAYTRPATTVGAAYLELMRGVLEPLGIAVLDASHASVRRAAAPVLQVALQRSREIAIALEGRDAALRAAGFEPQVALVRDLSLVFESDDRGVRRRLPVGASSEGVLSPNVLLRPVVERAILPTVTYVGGPGEIAYFAQVSAVAEAMSLARPRIVPRWSGSVIEPRVRDALELLGASVEDLAAPAVLAGRVARSELPAGARDALEVLRHAVADGTREIGSAVAADPQLSRAVGSARARMEWQIARLERRLAARAKHGETRRMRAFRLAEAALFPLGAPQERALSFIPFVARYGSEFVNALCAAAARHADSLIGRG